MKPLMLLLTLLLIFAPLTRVRCEGNESLGLTEKEAKLLYKGFRDIKAFAMISVSLVGDGEKIGLSERDLTEYAKTRFRKYFDRTKFEDASKDSKAFVNLLASGEKKVGNISFRVWVIGDTFPIVYHVKIDAGSFSNPAIYTEEILGHGSQKTTPDAIKAIIDEMMKDAAQVYNQVKAHDM